MDLLASANINWERKNALDPNALAKDEEFWKDIQKLYKPSKEFINLENGYYSMMSEPVRESQMTHLNHINDNHSYFMRRERKIDKEKIYQQVAELAGCSTEELLLCRNTTEALDTIILGLQLNKGD
ncbi:hypothetical protein Q2T40_00055 [Winogradskyella maritima]|nr:hypothetical protein [Winogradskyella maritima]